MADGDTPSAVVGISDLGDGAGPGRSNGRVMRCGQVGGAVMGLAALIGIACRDPSIDRPQELLSGTRVHGDVLGKAYCRPGHRRQCKCENDAILHGVSPVVCAGIGSCGIQMLAGFPGGSDRDCFAEPAPPDRSILQNRIVRAANEANAKVWDGWGEAGIRGKLSWPRREEFHLPSCVRAPPLKKWTSGIASGYVIVPGATRALLRPDRCRGHGILHAHPAAAHDGLSPAMSVAWGSG